MPVEKPPDLKGTGGSHTLKGNEPMTKMIKMTIATLALLTASSMAFAQEPRQNISPERHGNLAAAQDFSRQAFDRLTAAQDANEFDLGGHASRAKDLLRQANEEIKLAAIAANNK
jgi:hypothetical protein